MQVEGRAFIVTGASSGLGLATAQMLAQSGGRVFGVDVRPLNELERFGFATVRTMRADVTMAMQVEAAVREAADAFGAVHGLVNCAGIAIGERVIGRDGPHDLDRFARVVMVNLVGTFNMLRVAAAAMATHDPDAGGERGVIVNTASIAAFDGQIGQAAYAASKAGVAGLTLPAARELARHGIRVVTIAPGLFETPMMESLPDDVKASLGASVPFPSRLGRPDEFAALARHCIENRMLNGEVIRLDGALRMAPR